MGLTVSGVVVRHGPATSIGPITIDVPTGSVLGLVGPNASGKTTLMKAVCGLIGFSGDIVVAGETVVPGRPTPGTGAMIEEPRFYDWLSACDNLRVACGGEADRLERIATVLSAVELGSARSTRVREMSQGMRQRLGIARALLGDPRVLLLDEPTNGLDRRSLRGVRDLLLELKARGTTIVLSSHMLGEVTAVADRLLVLDAGVAAAAGELEDVLAGHASLETLLDDLASAAT